MSKNDRLLSGCSMPDSDSDDDDDDADAKEDPTPDILWWLPEWWCRWCAAGTATTETAIMASRVAMSTNAFSKPIPPRFFDICTK